MRHYTIYLIEDDVAKSYFGKEDKLYDLFKEARQTRHPLYRRQLERQIQYITKIIPLFYFDKKLVEMLDKTPGYQLIGNKHMMKGFKGDSYAELAISEQYIVMKASGSFEAETSFFEALRQMTPYFIAVDFNHDRYGWLKPIKNAHLI